MRHAVTALTLPLLGQHNRISIPTVGPKKGDCGLYEMRCALRHFGAVVWRGFPNMVARILMGEALGLEGVLLGCRSCTGRGERDFDRVVLPRAPARREQEDEEGVGGG